MTYKYHFFFADIMYVYCYKKPSMYKLTELLNASSVKIPNGIEYLIKNIMRRGKEHYRILMIKQCAFNITPFDVKALLSLFSFLFLFF